MTTDRPVPPLPPGFIALHGNRIETLLDTVAGWLAQHPLAPLESEVILVQSNGMAEWVKMAIARRAGVCAAAAVQLPARFQWQTYRQVLGRAQVPARSPLDKTALAWRLMRLLPEVLAEPGFAPVAGYLAEDDPGRRFQLALRIADLYDQYQVHRPDWLDTWGEGHEVLVDAGRFETPLPEDQRWQARLWQRVLDELEPQQRALTRPQLHDRVLAALEAAAEDAAPRPA
ncbi:exodeoxyribonuclease V subunit gamma, partial [Thauera phenylacetica B4P]